MPVISLGLLNVGELVGLLVGSLAIVGVVVLMGRRMLNGMYGVQCSVCHRRYPDRERRCPYCRDDEQRPGSVGGLVIEE